MEYLNGGNFGQFKALLFFGFFTLLAAAQWRFAHQHSSQEVFSNFKRNLPVGLINFIIFGAFCGGCVCLLAERVRGAGLVALLSVPYWVELIVSLVVLDLSAYVFHRLYHRLRFLWAFHSVHHSNLTFETSTAIRFHPGELLVALGARLALVWFFGFPVLGLYLFEAVFLFFNLLEHSDLALPTKIDRAVSLIFITPSMHRIHHSKITSQQNSNYGTIFSMWDRIFGTLQLDTHRAEIDVGILGQERLGLRGTLMLPIRRLLSS